MPKISITIWLPMLLFITALVSLLLGGFLGVLLVAELGTHAVRQIHWTTIVNNQEVSVPFNVMTEERDFRHPLGYRQSNQALYCDCTDDCPFLGPTSLTLASRHIEHQSLLRQRVVDRSGHTTLDCHIRIDGFLSEDGRHYRIHLSVLGGNFAGTDFASNADYDPDTQRLTFNVRQKLYREPFKRYQFEFELQDNPAPSRQHHEWEIPSMFVPVKRD